MLDMIKQIEIQNSAPDLSERLQKLVKKYKMTHIMIIDACGVSYYTIYKLFHGGKLSCTSLLKIAEGLDKLEKNYCDI